MRVREIIQRITPRTRATADDAERADGIEAALATEAKDRNATVHMPRIGCGLAGGRWDAIEPIIERTLCENRVDAFVYDLE